MAGGGVGMADLFFAPRWETLWLWLLLWLPLLVLSAVCVVTLDRLEPKRRRGLFALFSIMLGLAAALFGGALLLEKNGLAWRTWVQEGMSGALWVAGLTTGTLTIVYARRWLPERHKTAGKIAVGLSALCLVSAMLVGTVLGGLWSMGPGEEVGTYQGRKVVQGKWTWQECTYELYEYHGPLIRGSQSFLWGESPLLDGAAAGPL